MDERHLGKSGLQVSLLGLGGNNFGLKGNNFGGVIDLETTRRIIHKALDLGITLIDTADVYGKRGGSESCIGEILGERRKDVVLATKWDQPMDEERKRLKGASRRYALMAVEASLKRLRTDWIDIYQMHHPDPWTPIEETLRAMEDLIRSGKVRYIGASNFSAWRIVEAQWTARQIGTNGFIACQDEYNLLSRDVEHDLVPALQAYGVGLLPFFPLASGLLSGKYKRGAAPPEGSRLALSSRVAEREITDARMSVLDRLAAFCAERDRSMLELAFSWLASRPQVAGIIVGATSAEQIEQNARALQWQLSADEISEVDRITAPLMRPAKSTPFSTRHA
ncbi:MAG: aldo/keto reductase [Hyphomicrobiales bacterium]|nr:aldo/keto reductase [Hyphomicrobiales bacterium]